MMRKTVVKPGSSDAGFKIGSAAQRQLERALLEDLALLQMRLGRREGIIRNELHIGRGELFLQKDELVGVINGMPVQHVWRERESDYAAAVERRKGEMRELSQDELQKKMRGIDEELESGKEEAVRLLREYAGACSGGLKGVLAAIEGGIRSKLEELIKRRDELATARDAAGKLRHWPTGPC